MKILSVLELKSLPNIDEKALEILLPILQNQAVINFIKYHKENTHISAEEMKIKFDINCHILFVKAGDEKTVKSIVVPLENKISGGGKPYSSQYKAYGMDDGQTYFVKSFQLNEDSLPEYNNEIETFSQIKNRLVGIVSCEETQINYLVTTFVKGMDLAKYKQEMPASVEVKHFLETVGIFISASHQVKKFHELNLIHRDIKPGNIMIDADRQCHLIDFGSSSSDEEWKPVTWGTQFYLAPELDVGNSDLLPYTQESDLYAFGCSLYEIFEKFSTRKFVQLTIKQKNKHFEHLHTEIGQCIEGLKSTQIEMRTTSLHRMTQLQKVPDSFKSNPEAYTFMIMLLTQWKNSYEGKQELETIIERIKVAYENHEQDPAKIKELLETLSKVDWLLQPHKAMLTILIHAFDNIQKPEVGYDDILPRRFESDFVSQLIENPTPKMMSAIKQVSDAIITILQEYKDSDSSTLESQVIEDFLKQIVESDILFGASKTKPKLGEVIDILNKNNPQDFITIQHISFKFAQVALRKLALHDLPAHEPTGQFLKILQKCQKIFATDEAPLNLYHRMAAIKDNESDGQGDGYRFRAYICDELIYKDELFTMDATRGRKGQPDTNLKTNQVGLMKFEHAAHTKGLLILPKQAWYTDCKTQPADETSIHYTSAINTDCPYITGPSGMTSLFMNMMFLLVNPQDSETILAYSLGVMTYIVGAGYHSMKEVLIPMVKCVDIVPGYPRYDKASEYLKAAPLYNHYFREIERFDGEFIVVHQKIWQKHLEYFTNTFMPNCMRNNCLPDQVLAEQKEPDETKEMKSIVSYSVRACLAGYYKVSTSKGNTSLFVTTEDRQAMTLNLLNNVCQRQLTVVSMFRHIHSYFKGTFYTENELIINPHMQRSFIGYLFNSLKEKPTLLSYFNLAMKIERTISISSGIDVCSEEYKSERVKIHLAIKSVDMSVESVAIAEVSTKNTLPSVIYGTYILPSENNDSVQHHDSAYSPSNVFPKV